MVGILQFFDFGQGRSSHKLPLLSRRNDGLEAPRNSLEFPMEAYQSFQVANEDIPYSHRYSNKDGVCQNGAHMKELIDDEMSKRTKDRCNGPSVVARLMGMDALPSDIKPVIHAKDLNDMKKPRKELTSISSNQQASLILKTMRQSNEFFSYQIEQDFDQHTKDHDMDKPQPREHPQEELLQKFKKEFEAWQASKAWERSVTLELGNDLQKEKHINTSPQEILNSFVDAKRSSFVKKTTEFEHHVPSARLNTHWEQEDLLSSEAFVSKHSETGLTKDNFFRDNARSKSPKSDHEMEISTLPRRIVILRPGYEMNDYTEESCLCSPVMLQKGKNMHDFLEQVKERLITEIEGKPRLETTTIWTQSEAFASERLSDYKQIVPKTVKGLSESISIGNKTPLMQSRSTKSYKNKVQFSGWCSPEFIHQDTKKLLSERLKNVQKDDTDIMDPLISSGGLITSISSKEAEKFNSMQYFSKKSSKTVASWEEKKFLNESKSFRHDQGQAFDVGDESLRNLFRSFSAPVSRTAFGKLLLEDKNATAAVHICRKHEASENDLMEARKKKKDGFNIKNRVSNLKQNFTLKGKLFGKRIQLMDESSEDEFLFMKDAETSPFVMNFGFQQENSTEVPPSPASVCSSTHDEICRPYYPSPVSPLEALFHEDHPSLPASGEPNSNIPESDLPEEVDYDRSEQTTDELKPSEDELPEIEGNTKAYIRDILITCGLFERNHFDQCLWEWNTPRKPIPILVFDEVEETYQRNDKLKSRTTLICEGEDVGFSHRILFDLLNEALLSVVQNSKPGSTVKKWFPGPGRVPQGDQLLDSLWHLIQVYINPPVDESHPLESLVAQEMNQTSWSGMLHEDVDIISVEIELLIVENLIDELVCCLS
ncbi:hypothetical protein MUK42_29971 [Musa troglodytarum]|uniref:DUF4378 domain-containing protein n=1 Tax=Musa troglodytarum TaxID=320322 RepID=A0A9E7FM02_9LILI|nr:hypothetical protein MUK42_29971 [Musa troglodytarum]URD98228.1 hypothetical protein MUK42_29971 [Musa troglodytarum]URD98229.1 hypothetical protein MUK42_29971 [Musa troglodytarum]URD98230.1 hypothetical protein MUK42_29971 [Musa troglodytarum]URD98231.1 hypothetical protein MUK42_29971 [Musa troglodytarum]